MNDRGQILKELELYIHIPFCVRKCAYCDFLSAPADADTIQDYADALAREIQGCKNRYQHYRVSTVFVGGGTPSLLSADQVRTVFSALRGNFSIAEDAEITLELNPGTVTEEKLLAWKEVGINRLSIGLQSAKDPELQMLGRIHDYQQFLDTWERVRKAGMENVNVDLISAIPGQTLESWEETLRKTAALGPEHLSVYSLILEEGTPLYERYKEGAGDFPPLPDEETERRMYEETEKILKEYGYARYEISNYAKPGFECRHNTGYWQRTEYLGLGLGASSLIGNSRFRHITDLQAYLSLSGDVQAVCEEEEVLSKKDEMEEFMFLGLRMMRGVRRSEFLRLFGIPMEEVYARPLKKMEENQLIETQGDIVRLTKRGIDISNYVFGQFLLE